jgi:hypothetical protein
MKNLFQIQTESGQLWPHIKAHLDGTANLSDPITELKDQHALDLAAEGRAVHDRLDALVKAGQDAHAKGDLVAIGKVLDAAYGYTSGARKAKLEAELAKAKVAVTAATTALDSL